MHSSTFRSAINNIIAAVLTGKPTTVDADAFRGAMRQLAGCVTVIATEENGKLYGFTATAVCSVCAAPPTVLIVVNRSARTHSHIDRRGAFAINILADGQRGIAEHFSVRGDDKFSSVSYTLSGTGVPLIEGAAAHLECEVQKRIPIGTHTVFVAHVIGTGVKIAAPLIYHDAKYGLVAHI